MSENTAHRTEEMSGQDTYDVKSERDLRELYYGKSKTMSEVSDAIGCSNYKVRKWMNKHDIERRDRSQAITMAYGPLSMKTDHHGYEKFQHTYHNNNHVLQVHRLQAVAEYGFEAVADNHVHHRNNIPWDNRAENLDVLSGTEHKKRHGKYSITDKLLVKELAHSEGMKRRVIADKLDMNTSTVCSIASMEEGY